MRSFETSKVLPVFLTKRTLFLPELSRAMHKTKYDSEQEENALDEVDSGGDELLFPAAHL